MSGSCRSGRDLGRAGQRRPVAEDFLFDSPVLVGSQRIGPDLAKRRVAFADPNLALEAPYAPQQE